MHKTLMNLSDELFGDEINKAFVSVRNIGRIFVRGFYLDIGCL